MAESQKRAVFADGGAYEKFMGKRSRITGRLFVDWLKLPDGLRWLDVGCGTGAFSTVILDECAPAAVVGIDPSEAQVNHAQNAIGDDRASFRVGDALSLPLDDDAFDAAVSSYVLNFVPDKQKKMDEMARVVGPGGTVAVSVLDHAGGNDPARHFWQRVQERDVEFSRAEFSKRGWDITRPETLSAFFETAGLDDIATHAIDFEDSYEDFSDYWSSMTGLPTSSLAQFAAQLDNGERDRFKQQVEDILPKERGGRIRYTSRAWAVRGLVPSV